MKTTLLLFSLCFWLQTTIHAQTTILIFKDHSTSIADVSAEQTQNENKILKHQLLKKINASGDKVVISYLYDNTASLSNRKTLTFTMPQPPKSNATAIEKAQYQSKVAQAKMHFIKGIIVALQTDIPKSGSTQILEGMPLVAELLKDKGQLFVWCFSDMVESSKRRNLYGLTSRADAESKAKADVKTLMDDFKLKPQQRNDTEIACYLPIAMLDSSEHLKFIDYYWSIVFKQLFGITNLKFQTL